MPRKATRDTVPLAWFVPYLWFDDSAVSFCKTGAIVVNKIIMCEFKVLPLIFLIGIQAIVAIFAKFLTELGINFRSCH
jgi:hypothetical protein